MGSVKTDNTGDICKLVGKMSSQEVAIEVQGSLREDLINTAVNFLTSPNVRGTSDSRKELFLKKKGLTGDEIRIAFERSSVISNNIPYRHEAHLTHPVQATVTQMTLFQKIKDVLNTIALLFGASYGLYYLYKKFVSPFLFGKPKKPDSIESSINELNESVKKTIGELKKDVSQVHEELEKVVTVQTEQQNYIKDISLLKSEVTSVKGILLNRHQFPTVGLSSTSIPAWQLTGSAHKDDKEIEDVEHNSGSSEAEIVQVPNSNGGSQGSDSSLEMIKEVDG